MNIKTLVLHLSLFPTYIFSSYIYFQVIKLVLNSKLVGEDILIHFSTLLFFFARICQFGKILLI